MSATDDFAAFQAERERLRHEVEEQGVRWRYVKIIGAPSDAPMGYIAWRGEDRAYARQTVDGWEVGRWIKRELHPITTCDSKHEAFSAAVEIVLHP